MPDFIHQPVLEAEVIAALRPRPNGRFVDATLGGGGHAAALLRASHPSGWLFGCDRDGAAVEACRARLAEFAERCELRQGNFTQLAEWIEPESCQGVLMDLGVSSPQLDVAERGFSFLGNGPLDMRMDQRQTLTAAAVLDLRSEAELARIFFELGEEPRARRIARVIVEEREQHPFETTGQLARTIERIMPRQGKKRHPATRVFQALRMEVNDELNSLRSGLAAAWSVLEKRGRLAVITFHSLEDRAVKQFGRELSRGYTFPGEVDVPELRIECPPKLEWIGRKATKPSEAEVEANPRARSAQLRVMEKIG